ncbi:hypothetical protein Ancab_021501 [Ancistrocladus abbreviatus]
MEKEHFSHDHTLLEVECTAELCAGCRSDINGLAFGCIGCRFFLHKLCANLPQLLGEPFSLWGAERLELQLFPLGPGDDYSHCRDCYHRIYEQGFVYVRYTRDENAGQVKVDKLHVDCALLRHPYHIHSLVYIEKRMLFSAECAECGVKFHENEYKVSNLYGCRGCDCACHEKCLDLSAPLKRMVEGFDNIPGYLDPVSWNFNEWDHYFCDGCKESYQERVDPTKERLQHFSHRHPLVELEHTSQLCSGCSTIIDGPSFGCARCEFYLHKHYTELPRELHHPMHPSRPLKLVLSKHGRFEYQQEYPFDCKLCDCGLHKRQQCFIYKCHGGCSSNECMGFVVHAKCALLESLNSLYHKHQLIFIQKKGHANCVACRTKFEFESEGTYLYFCCECGDGFHKECIDMPSQVKRDRHPHDLTLYLNPIPDNYEEKKYYCDDCNEERDIHAFSYACIECDFICHTRCDLFKTAQEAKDEAEERECEVLVKREEEELDKIKKELKMLQKELDAKLSEKSRHEAALKDLKERRDQIREKRGRN